MIGLDTNVLVRLLAEDDAEQQKRVVSLLRRARNQGEMALVSVPVLCETVWVLSASYGFDRGHITKALESILETDVFQLEDEKSVIQAIQSWRTSGGDFTDHLIACRHREAGCRTTMTFDRKAGKLGGFTLLK